MFKVELEHDGVDVFVAILLLVFFIFFYTALLLCVLQIYVCYKRVLLSTTYLIKSMTCGGNSAPITVPLLAYSEFP